MQLASQTATGLSSSYKYLALELFILMKLQIKVS